MKRVTIVGMGMGNPDTLTVGALRALRDLTLDGSIRLMHTLSTDQTLEQLLEQAKGEKNLQRIRMYLRLLEE